MSDLGCGYLEFLLRYFGNGATPNYSKTLSVLSRDPYRPIRERLEALVGCHDSTDYNYDLGTSWWFKREDESWNLRLSFVGPFALLLRSAGEVVTSDPVLELTRSHGFMAQSRTELDLPVRIWEPEVEGCLYEFLFEFDNGRPWDE